MLTRDNQWTCMYLRICCEIWMLFKNAWLSWNWIKSKSRGDDLLRILLFTRFSFVFWLFFLFLIIRFGFIALVLLRSVVRTMRKQENKSINDKSIDNWVNVSMSEWINHLQRSWNAQDNDYNDRNTFIVYFYSLIMTCVIIYRMYYYNSSKKKGDIRLLLCLKNNNHLVNLKTTFLYQF